MKTDSSSAGHEACRRRVTRASAVTLGSTILLVAALWFAAFERLAHEHDELIRAEQDKNDEIALAHEERTARSIEVFDGALRFVRHQYLQGALPDDLQPLLDASGLDRHYYTVFSVIDANGDIVASNLPDMKANFRDRGYFKDHAANPEDKLLVGQPITGRLTGRTVVSFTRRIELPGGGFGGVVFVAIDPAFLASLYDRSALGTHGVMALVGLDGIVRVRRSGSSVTFGEDISKGVLFENLAVASVGRYVSPSAIDGVARATSYRRMTSYPLVTAIGSELEGLLEQNRDRDTIIIGAASGATMLLVLLCIVVLWEQQRSIGAVRKAEADRLVYARLNSALNESEARANRIIESTPSAMLVVRADGSIARANTRAELMFGYAPGEMDGLSVERLLPAELRSFHAQRRLGFQLAGATRCMGQGTELFGVRKDDTQFPVEIGLAPLDVDGSAAAIASIVDITQRKAFEAELERHRDHLEETVNERTAQLVKARDDAERSARAKAQFLANMSHEIRTPLNAINGMAHLIRRQGLNDKQSRQMESLERAGAHLLSVINAILDLSKIDAGALRLAHESLSIRALVQDVADMQRPTASSRGLVLSTQVSSVPDLVLGDSTRLKQALLNYVSNALKFTTAGSVVIGVQVDDEDDTSVLIRFSVRDTGIGLAEAELPRLFKAFEQADNSSTRQYGGTGLGLAITQLLARAMSGDAGASGQLGVGSTFWFTARLQKCTSTARSPAEATTRPLSHERFDTLDGRSALLVDDEPVNREVALSFLELAGVRVTAVASGREAVEAVRGQRFDVIVMDVQMPEVDGLTTTRRIREQPHGRSVPIVAMTANAFMEDELDCIAAGMNGYLAKPFEPADLYALLADLLDDGGAESAGDRPA